MKIAVIKLGSRISFNANDTSGGNGEARSIIKMLHQGGAEVHIYTKILKKDNLLPEYTWHNLSDAFPLTLPGIDALVVLNGNVNFFGGAEDPEQLLNYAIINSFPGKVFYLLCDPELTLKQVWPSVEKKEWATNWSKELLHIGRTDIVYLSQPYDVEKVFGALKKNEIIPASIHHFPFEKFPCLNERLHANDAPRVDLSYGGTMRGGKRAKKMVKFYFGYPDDISVEMFGKIELSDFSKCKVNLDGLRAPNFTGTVRYDQMLPKMNEALATVVIGDPWYEQINDMAQRAYESIWSGVITFIDADLDKQRRVYGSDSALASLLYVESKDQVVSVLRELKNDPGLRKAVLEAQLAATDFDANTYCKSFVNLLKEKS